MARYLLFQFRDSVDGCVRMVVSVLIQTLYGQFIFCCCTPVCFAFVPIILTVCFTEYRGTDQNGCKEILKVILKSMPNIKEEVPCVHGLQFVLI